MFTKMQMVTGTEMVTFFGDKPSTKTSLLFHSVTVFLIGVEMHLTTAEQTDTEQKNMIVLRWHLRFLGSISAWFPLIKTCQFSSSD